MKTIYNYFQTYLKNSAPYHHLKRCIHSCSSWLSEHSGTSR